MFAITFSHGIHAQIYFRQTCSGFASSELHPIYITILFLNTFSWSVLINYYKLNLCGPFPY